MRVGSAVIFVALLLSGSARLLAQDAPYLSFVRPNQQVLVRDLQLRIASSQERAATLAAAVETVLANSAICCGKDSTFSEIPDLANNTSLQKIGAKLDGKHVLADGRPFVVAANYLPGARITSFELVRLLMKNEPMLVEWDSRIFVVQGATFDDDVYSDGSHDYILRALLLLDSSPANNHEVTFDRQKDDWSKIDGFLLLKASS